MIFTNLIKTIILSGVIVCALQCMEDSCEEKKFYNAYFFINTAEFNENNPENGDFNCAIFKSFTAQLANNNTDFIFFPYSMLEIIQKYINTGNTELLKYGVLDPLAQTIINRKGKYYPSKYFSYDPQDPLAGERIPSNFGITKIIFKEAVLIKHPTTVKETSHQELSRDNYREHIIKPVAGPEFTDDMNCYFSLLLSLRSRSWKVFDTNYGLYCLSRLDADQSPLQILQFTQFPSLENIKDKKSDTNNWIYNLSSILKSDPQVIWSFYIEGHGEEDNDSGKSIVAGIREKKIADLLANFDAMETPLVTIISCFTNTPRLLAIVRKHTDKKTLKYTLLAHSNKEKSTSQPFLSKVQCYYPVWFNGKEKLKITDTQPPLKSVTANKELLTEMCKNSSNGEVLSSFLLNTSPLNIGFRAFSILPSHAEESLLFTSHAAHIKHSEIFNQ